MSAIIQHEMDHFEGICQVYESTKEEINEQQEELIVTITETKIRGLEVRIDEHKIKILDAFQIKDRKKMKMILENALDKDSEFKTERTIKSLIKE